VIVAMIFPLVDTTGLLVRWSPWVGAQDRRRGWIVTTGGARSRATVVLAEDARTVYLLPGPPAAERSAEGVPAVTLLGSESIAFLQVGAQWWPSADDQRLLLGGLAELAGVPAGELMLSSEGVTDVAASLQFLTGDGANREVTTLATSSTSLVPPYVAAMSASLTRDLVPGVRRAVEGETGVLQVWFEGTVSAAPLVSTVLSAPASTEVVGALSRIALDDARSSVEALVPAVVRRVRTGDTSLDTSAVDRSDAAAARALVRAATDLNEPEPGTGITTPHGRLLAIGSATADHPARIRGVADIADWTASSPSRHVVLADAEPGTTS